MNLLRIHLRFLALGEPTVAPPEVRLGQELTSAQRAAVEHLSALLLRPTAKPLELTRGLAVNLLCTKNDAARTAALTWWEL